jgi:hypothetical protein
MSTAERRCVEDVLKAAGGPARRLMVAARRMLTLWGASFFLVLLVWLTLAWPVQVMGGRDAGLHSPFAPWIFGLGVPLCAVYAAIFTVRWTAHARKLLPALRADLETGDVIEESYRFTAARRFQEPEHGGLMYLLRTSDDRVFVLYDSESQALGAQQKDPLGSSFRPRSDLRVVRAPKSGVIVGKSLTGDLLDPGDPLELSIPPKDWPAPDAYCDLPWSDLERRLSRSEERG